MYVLFDVVSFKKEYNAFVKTYWLNLDTQRIETLDYQVPQKALAVDPSGPIELLEPKTGEKWRFKPMVGFERFKAEKENTEIFYNKFKPNEEILLDLGLTPGMWYDKIPFEPQKLNFNEVYKAFPDPERLNCALAWDLEIACKDEFPDADKAEYPITMCSMVYRSAGKLTYILFYNQEVCKNPETELMLDGQNIILEPCATEKELISQIVQYLYMTPLAPINVAYNSRGFDLVYMRNRAKLYKFVVFEGTRFPEEIFKKGYSDVPHIDVYQFFQNPALKIYLYNGEYVKNKLDDVAEALLGDHKLDVSFKNSSDSEIMVYCVKDSLLTLKLYEHSIDVWLFISRISNAPLSQIQRTKISNWITNAINRMHVIGGYAVMDKGFMKRSAEDKEDKEDLKEKESLVGGLVLDPVPGLHRDVYVVDFASEYPNIIISKNLSYENLGCKHKSCEQPECGLGTKVCMKRHGIFSKWMLSLRTFRVKTYKPLKDWRSKLYAGALKVFMNSSIGVFGAQFFQFFEPRMFNAVTGYGRWSLRQIVTFLERFPGIKVIYGATDSVFFQSEKGKEYADEVIEKTITFAKETLLLELEHEKTFEVLFLTSRKSNYFGLYKKSLKFEIKGISLKKANVPESMRTDFMNLIDKMKEALKNPDFGYEQIEAMVMGHYRKGLERYKLPTKENYKIFSMFGTYQKKEYKTVPMIHKVVNMLPPHEKALIGSGSNVEYYKSKTAGAKPFKFITVGDVDTKAYITMYENAYNQILESFGAANLDSQSLFTFLKPKPKV